MLNAKRTSIRDLLLKVKNPISESTPLRKKHISPNLISHATKEKARTAKQAEAAPAATSWLWERADQA